MAANAAPEAWICCTLLSWSCTPAAVTTMFSRPPGHNGAIAKNGSKCSSRGLDLLHVAQLVLYPLLSPPCSADAQVTTEPSPRTAAIAAPDSNTCLLAAAHARKLNLRASSRTLQWHWQHSKHVRHDVTSLALPTESALCADGLNSAIVTSLLVCSETVLPLKRLTWTVMDME